MARWIFVIAIAYFSLRYLPPWSERNVLVMVETQGLYIDSLSNITGLKAAFQVRKSYDEYVLGDQKREEIEKRVCYLNVIKFQLILFKQIISENLRFFFNYHFIFTEKI